MSFRGRNNLGLGGRRLSGFSGRGLARQGAVRGVFGENTVDSGSDSGKSGLNRGSMASVVGARCDGHESGVDVSFGGDIGSSFSGGSSFGRDGNGSHVCCQHTINGGDYGGQFADFGGNQADVVAARSLKHSDSCIIGHNLGLIHVGVQTRCERRHCVGGVGVVLEG